MVETARFYAYGFIIDMSYVLTYIKSHQFKNPFKILFIFENSLIENFINSLNCLAYSFFFSSLLLIPGEGSDVNNCYSNEFSYNYKTE